MPPGDCSCNEDISQSCDSLFTKYLSEDFVQDLLHFKCKVVKLAREQIEKSRHSQNSILFENDEITRICACNGNENIEKTQRRKKRETEETPLKDNATATDNCTILRNTKQETALTNLLSKFLKFLATYRSTITLILISLAIAMMLYFGFVCSMVIGTSICKKGGFCLPFKIRSTKPRVF